ncbi:MAG: haloacid dehalogenase type II [Pelagimonas sp.]|jgi:2-haloacid dehalogenase|nr:haloacid dehalogenase type II [Pelagimonas sp.]
MAITTCVFDAYGTLFDVTSAARRAAEQPGRDALAGVWQQLAADWRAKQLEYSWLRQITGDYVSFWELTKNGLDWAMERAGLTDPVLREDLLALYWELSAYKEVPFMLAHLKARGIQTAVLSNGNRDMLEGAVDSSKMGMYLDKLISVEEISMFKPAAQVYDLVGKHFGTARDEVLFVSSNGWDAAGAANYGFRTVWVNRMGLPVDRLMAQPDLILPDLSTIPEVL